MIAVGMSIELYIFGGYNSDAHLVIRANVEENGYMVVSYADSIYDETAKGSQCHVPVGFFARSPESIVEDLKKTGIIPPYFADWEIRLNPDRAEALYQYDRKRRVRA